MENQITVFSNSEFGEVRTTVIDGEPYFVGKDVAEALGYASPRATISKKVDSEDKGVAKMETPSGTQEMTVINESGVYALVFGSKLESAKRFKHWVTSEVLPAIRKYGGYLIPQKVEEALLNPDVLIELATQLKVEREKNKELEVQNELMKPKASYYDIVLQSDSLLPITVIAKDYGWSAIKLNNFLCFNKVQYKCDGTYVLYQKYAHEGYVGTKTNTYTDKDNEVQTKVHTYWTQKGRLFIYELMKKNGYLPLIEQNETEN